MNHFPNIVVNQRINCVQNDSKGFFPLQLKYIVNDEWVAQWCSARFWSCSVEFRLGRTNVVRVKT